MDWTLKRCRISRNSRGPRKVDWISCLPNELLARILSLLSTKEAAATSVLSRRWRHAFTWITSLDFDGAANYHGYRCPKRVQHFSVFKTFVDHIVQVSQSKHVGSFTLRFGPPGCLDYLCSRRCLPNVISTDLNSWISFPLTRGVRELCLDFQVRNPGKLPSALFTCETLEVLKLAMNLDLQVPVTIRLPNLKVFFIDSLRIPVQDFVSRLTLGCPLLEDLHLTSYVREQGDVIIISAPSLRTLILGLGSSERDDEVYIWCELVVLDTPKLQNLTYEDNMLAHHYSIGNMSAVVKAGLFIYNPLHISMDYGEDAVFCNMLSLLKPLSNVEDLSLFGFCLESLQLRDLKDKLPVFHHLRHLHLGYRCFHQWHKVLLELLNCSPCLEMLEFPEGLSEGVKYDQPEVVKLECEFWKTTQAIPACLNARLKRIVIKQCCGSERELSLIRFFLMNASVLEELSVTLARAFTDYSGDRHMSFEMTLTKLQKASVKCSIVVN